MNKNKYLYIMLVLLILFSFTANAQSNRTKSIISEKEVLILNGFQYGLPVTDTYTKSIVDTLIASGMPVSNIFVEYLDLNRNDNDDYRSIMQNNLKEISTNHSIDLIITIDQVAADFITNEGKYLFEGVPLIVSYDKEPVWKGPAREIIIAASSNDAKGTVKYAFELFPNTKNVVFIMGKNDENAPFLERLVTAIKNKNIDQQINIERTADLSYTEMLKYVADLKPDTIAFYGSYFKDINNEKFVPASVANDVSQAASAPVFAFVDMHIKQGLVGGSVVPHDKLGQQVAKTARDYLSGGLMLSEQPTRIYPQFYPFFDWEQLNRWNADPNKLPEETIFLNYKPGLWEEHRQLIILTSVFIIILIVLIILLIAKNRKQNKLLIKLNKSKKKLRNAYDSTIEGWSYALDLKDEETKGHSKRVTELALHIAEKMGIEEDELDHVYRGALLHDIGKMGIPDSILLKPGKLTEEEWKIMRKHSVYAFEMLSSIDYLQPALDIPYCHHEKWDGSGYPRGLEGEQIPLSARIFAVVDVYDALTSARPYREAWTNKKALNYISENAGEHFDPEVVEVFLKEMIN